MDFQTITRKRAKVTATRQRLPLNPSPGPAANSPPPPRGARHLEPAKSTSCPKPDASREAPCGREAGDTSDVRWEKVHAVKSAIASGHYDVEGRLMHLLDRFADAELPGQTASSEGCSR